MNMNGFLANFEFEVDVANVDVGGFCFVDSLHVHIGNIFFGKYGTLSEKKLVIGSISDMIRKIKQQELHLNFNTIVLGDSPQSFTILNDVCWGSGDWPGNLPMAINEFPRSDIYLALPCALELFDEEEAYIILLSNGAAKLISRNRTEGIAREETISWIEYIDGWGKILTKIQLGGN